MKAIKRSRSLIFALAIIGLLIAGAFIIKKSPADNRIPGQSGSLSQAPTVPRAEDIRLVNARKIADGAYPNFSPDGKWIAFGLTMKRGLAVMRTDGTGEPRHIGSEYASPFGVVWTPDSREIFYLERSPIKAPPYFERMIQSVEIKSGRITSYPDIWDQKIYTLDELPSLVQAVKPSDPILYFQYPGLDDRTVSRGFIRARTKNRKRDWLVTPEKGQYSGPKLSPDKKTLLVESENGINIYATNGSGLIINLGEGSLPDQSPDGKVILYYQEESDGHVTLSSDLYAVNANGTGTKQLTFSPNIFEWFPMWSPDGKQVLFWESETASIYIADVVAE